MLVDLVEKTHSLLGGLNIVIFNAGWTKFVPFAKIDELDDEIWDGCPNANIKSHFYLFRAAKKYLERNVVSIAKPDKLLYASCMHDSAIRT